MSPDVPELNCFFWLTQELLPLTSCVEVDKHQRLTHLILIAIDKFLLSYGTRTILGMFMFSIWIISYPLCEAVNFPK